MKYTTTNRFSHHRSSTRGARRKSRVSFALPEGHYENDFEDIPEVTDETERTESQRSKSEECFVSEERRSKYIKNKERIKSISEGDDSANFPPDCYSFISLYGPGELVFWIGLMVFGFQMVFLGCALLSIANPKWRTGTTSDNPWDGVIAGLFATEVGPILRTTQFMSLITSVIFVDSSVHDIITAVHTFPNFAMAISSRDRVWCMAFSCILRLSQGLFALLVSIFLVFNSDNVIDVILNFTALNFISALDDLFFDFSKSGKYGPYLENATLRIEEERLPVCMFRKRKHVRPFYTFVPLFMIIILFSGVVVYHQEHETLWETLVFRIEIGDDAGLEKYNGCYNNDFKRDDDAWKRDFYVHDGNNTGHDAEFGFCIEDKRWILYDSNENSNETDICNLSEDEILLSSSATDSFDIHSSFSREWFSAKGTPVDVYFFDDVRNATPLVCNQFVNDGICNPEFNLPTLDFDGGDCCAVTCSHEKCGVMGLDKAFGSSNITGDGFPNCKDPSMVPIVIQLNNFTNNRALYNTSDAPLTSRQRSHVETFRPDFWDVTPADALLTLTCNGVKIMKVYINPDMINQTENVMVPEEAKCEIRITNSTSTVTHFDDDPLWYVDYTVYNHLLDTYDVPPVVVVEESSYKYQTVSFEKIPWCYGQKIFDSGAYKWNFTPRDRYDLYQKPTATDKAVIWMLNGTETKNGVCPENFMQLYALASMYFSAPSEEPWIQEDAPCNWPHIICVGAYNSSYTDIEYDLDLLNLDLAEVGLSGTISSEIGLLENLALYDISDNPGLTGIIPTTIQFLTSLATLKIENNTLTGSIPTEIGLLTELTRLHLTSNSWTGTIPSEIGKLTNLKSLRILDLQEIKGSIPTEIGLLNKLTSLRIGKCPDLISSIPSEIKSLTDLKLLTFKKNSLTGSIPSELGLLTSLTRLRLDGNPLSGSIPNELGSLTELTSLNIDNTELTGTFPAFWNKNKFRVVYMDNIDGIPKDNVPEEFSGKVAKECVICNDATGRMFDIDDDDDDGEKVLCTRFVEEWEYLGYRTNERECTFINEKCVECKNQSPDEGQAAEGGSSFLEEDIDAALLSSIP